MRVNPEVAVGQVWRRPAGLIRIVSIAGDVVETEPVRQTKAGWVHDPAGSRSVILKRRFALTRFRLIAPAPTTGE